AGRHPSPGRPAAGSSAPTLGRAVTPTPTSSPSPCIAAVGASLASPTPQADVEHLAARLHPAIDRDRVARIFANAGIEQRHLVQPLDWYGTDHPLEQRNAMA